MAALSEKIEEEVEELKKDIVRLGHGNDAGQYEVPPHCCLACWSCHARPSTRQPGRAWPPLQPGPPLSWLAGHQGGAWAAHA